ncbi:hypothetical protein PR002_g28498 [Phytophthora rubi]|uniref:Ankyrin repeat-containing domain n=1 Tax=Phytophthora rubi TaxID=129364 RepID=A0A6A3H8G1_9STRA|nr:hypothetical protein PR002_g28498 [Phytophthora rubi]
MEPPLQLKIVALALSRLENAAGESIGALVTDFLVWDMPLSKAVELSHAGSVALLDFVWMRGLRDVGRRRWTVAKLLHSEKYYYKWEFSLALAQVICAADLQMVQWIVQHFSGSRHRHWRVVHWLHERTGTPSQDGFRTENNVTECAFEQHNLEELRRATAHGFHVAANRFPDVCSDAEREMCWEAIRFLLSRGYGDSGTFVESAIMLAAKVGDHEFVQLLLLVHEDDRGSSEMGLMKASMVAGRYGHVLVLERLLTRLAELNIHNIPSSVMFEAAKYGKLEVVKWLVERREHLEVLKHLHHVDASQRNKRKREERQQFPNRDHSRRCTTKAMDLAASNGHLDVCIAVLFNITATMERAIICKEPEIVCYLDAQRADRTQSVDEMRARLRNDIPFFQR